MAAAGTAVSPATVQLAVEEQGSFCPDQSAAGIFAVLKRDPSCGHRSAVTKQVVDALPEVGDVCIVGGNIRQQDCHARFISMPQYCIAGHDHAQVPDHLMQAGRVGGDCREFADAQHHITGSAALTGHRR